MSALIFHYVNPPQRVKSAMPVYNTKEEKKTMKDEPMTPNVTPQLPRVKRLEVVARSNPLA